MVAAGQQHPVAPSRDSASLLAEFALSDLAKMPADVGDLARTCLIDAVACSAFGARFPWSRAVADATTRPPGHVVPPGCEFATTSERAALVAGVSAHAFELDSLRMPGAGVHPGATVALPALAVAQELRLSGGALLEAIVAGIEVMFRIGAATLHSIEARGFHAPGITGCLGSAVAAGRILGLTTPQMVSAMGIAASMSGGLLAFARAGSGGMVKRLHVGRAAENGIVAAKLAGRGFEAPHDILETPFGVLDAFCARSEPGLLTQGLGSEWETRRICIKHYACHVTAQGPVEILRRWIGEGLDPDLIREFRVSAPEKIADVHSQRHPGDIALAQYSLPFMLAFAAYHDVEDPLVLTDDALSDSRVRALVSKIEVIADRKRRGWSVGMGINANRAFECEVDGFLGTPDRPLSDTALHTRFITLAGDGAADLFEALLDIRRVPDVSDLPALGTRNGRTR